MAKRKTGRPKLTYRTEQIGIVLPVDISAEIRRVAENDGLTRAAWLRRAAYRQLAIETAK